MTEMYPNPNAKPNSNFKKIPLNSKLWNDSSFDEVSIVVVYGFDTDSEVYIGTWEAIEDFFEEGSEDEEFTPTSIGLLAPHKLSPVFCDTCGAEWHEGQPYCESCKHKMKKGKRWIRQGGGGMTYTEFDSEYIESIYTPKRNVDISTAMELWLF